MPTMSSLDLDLCAGDARLVKKSLNNSVKWVELCIKSKYNITIWCTLKLVFYTSYEMLTLL